MTTPVVSPIADRSRGVDWPWAGFFSADPRTWVLSCAEPTAHWVLLTGVLDLPPDGFQAATTRYEVVVDPGTRALIERLPDWEAGLPLSGHDSPAFAPNLLLLLADMGIRAGDHPRVDRALDQMLDHQDPEGRFTSSAPPRGADPPGWGALLCDTHAIIEVLVRFGFGADPRVRAGLDRMASDLTRTDQGHAWPCRAEPATGFRGPGRRTDFCPMVTLEALRTFALLPADQQPPDLLATARVALAGWTNRATSKPYMFGHGLAFKTVKWPPLWYRVDALLDALGRYPALWQGPGADPGDRRALAELTACLIRYNTTTQGQVIPHSAYRGFETYSFGQKKRPSPYATARLLAILHLFDDLAADALAVDVTALTSSKGGTGHALPPPRPST